MQKDFDDWNDVKKKVDEKETIIGVHERELWWCSLGVNVGIEADGKNQGYRRPVLIVRKFNRDMVWVLPATTQNKNPKFHESFTLNGQKTFIAVTQIRTLSTKRLGKKHGTVSEPDFKRIIKRVLDFFPK